MDARPALLYLVHRIPWPPNKGDKLRSFNILRQLARNYRVFLGCFADQGADMAHAGRLAEWCAGVHVERLHPLAARLGSLRGLLMREALSLPYYRSAGLQRWVRAVLAREGIAHAVAFSGPMAQYLDDERLQHRVIDFCDVDSAKWTQYAAQRGGVLAALYRREGRRLLAFERRAACMADAALFVTAAEAELFRALAPEAASRVRVMQNGVDTAYFCPDSLPSCPWPAGGPVLVFTGAMDYWPNVDAVVWFAHEVLPALATRVPGLRFFIVGMNPVAQVRALADATVTVTGSVSDVRPYLAHAAAAVAPLRVARGIQNKVLEAMAMGRAVVLTPQAATGLCASPGHDHLVADGASAFVDNLAALLACPARAREMGAQARRTVLARYGWDAHLAVLPGLLAAERPASGLDCGVHDGVAA